MFLESFALRSDLLLPIAAKVGKSARRNLRFLHLPAPLPLMPTPNSALAPTVENVSGSGARGADDSSYVTITTGFCERAVKGIKYERRHSVGGFLNRRFKLSFWVLLGQRPKVPRARKREISPLRRCQSGRGYGILKLYYWAFGGNVLQNVNFKLRRGSTKNIQRNFNLLDKTAAVWHTLNKKRGIDDALWCDSGEG